MWIFVVDFGLSKVMDEHYKEPNLVTALAPVMRYPQYIAPEIINGEPHSILSETFSIGAIAYELCTGRQLCPVPTSLNANRFGVNAAHCFGLPMDMCR